MAETKRKSQAQKAASAAKQKKSSGKTTKKNHVQTASASQAEEQKLNIPLRYTCAALCLILFVLFLVILLNPEGALVKLVGGFIMGLVGKVAFIVSIPALLYVFAILAFSKGRPVRLRCACVALFVVFCGCVSHLVLNPQIPGDLLGAIAGLYTGGASGTSAGLLCSGIGAGVQWLCGTVISYIVFILGAVIALLAAMRITLTSLVRAIQNRPRADWELEEAPEEEPAAVVVNTIARKRIERMEQKRAKAALQEPQNPQPPQPKKKPVPQDPADDLIRQIEGDTHQPVAAAGVAVTYEEELEAPAPQPVPQPKKPVHVPAPDPEPIPARMPEYVPMEEEAAPPVPVTAEIVESVAKAKVTAKDAQEAAAEVAAAIALEEEKAAAAMDEKPVYHYPPIDLLKLPGRGGADGTAEMRENSRRLNETLASFKIEAHIVNVTRGPSVTRYEVELEKGVRLSKLTSAADDIALSLGASGVRIAAVPDKISVVGIEGPNKAVTTVSLREVIDSNEFSGAKSKSSFAVGKDIGGKCIVGNIAKLPHMLIAGTTGSGKSVCMNSIIISLLYKASPDDVKLIMVDPKMVELGIYNGIPHLLIPVVTDPKKAAGSLQWAVTEMMRRYKYMSDAGVRDLESYNAMIENEEIDGQKLPQVVVIIDELADLMLVAAKEVEESICRIAQMGRASGIHLVIATQRPSADVITGLMKANIPSRIAFAVASAMESRIILDTQGAEKLVGKGDMLFAPIGTGKPQRVQGCFVSDPEVEAVATFVKNNYATSYDESVMDEIEKKAAQTGSSKSAAADPVPNSEEIEGDEMLPQAVDVILETGQASVSMLQRRLKLGYARAARIVDEMEDKGIVGPFQGSKPRAILVTKEQWAAMKSGGQVTQMNFEDLAEEPPFDPEENEDPV